MRWSLRRSDSRAGSGAHDTPVPAAAAAPSPDGPAPAPSAVAVPVAPSWSALPPLTQSWATRAPLTTTGSPTVAAPPLTEHRARAVPGSSGRPDGAPEPGRVVGLASVIAPVAPVADPAPDVAAASPYLRQPPLRHATARAIVEHAPLTEATDDFVGPPRESAPPPPPPPAAPTFFPPQSPPRAEPAPQAATDAGEAFRQALANLRSSGLPEYVPGSGTPDPGAAPARPDPPFPAPAPAADTPAERQPLTHRRNSLAESRRRGLGAPIAPDAEPSAAPPPHPLVPDPPAPASAATDTGAGSPTPAPPADAAGPVAPATHVPRVAPAPPEAATPDPTHGRHRSAGDPGRLDSPGPEPLRVRPAVRPVTGAGTRPAARATPLVYRAAPRAVDAGVAARTPERAVVTRAPAELANSLRASRGVDVADVPVRRDTEAGAEAHRRQARAFTRGGTVYLPEAAGPIDSTQARSLLAHELVHAAQQRRLGTALPAEHSPEGRALEAEALEAERAHGGSIPDPPALRHAPPPVSAGWVDDRITQHRVEAPSSGTVFHDDERQEIEWISQETATRTYQEIGGQAAGSGGGIGPSGMQGIAPGGSTTRSSGPSSGAGVSSGPSGAELTDAATYDDFERQMIVKLNAVRAQNNLGPTTSAGLSSEDRQLLRTRWNETVALHEHARQQVAAATAVGGAPGALAGLAGTSWTPATGFQRGGTGGPGAGQLPGGSGGLGGGGAGASALGGAGRSGLAASLAQATTPADYAEHFLANINSLLSDQGRVPQSELTPEQRSFADAQFALGQEAQRSARQTAATRAQDAVTAGSTAAALTTAAAVASVAAAGSTSGSPTSAAVTAPSTSTDAASTGAPVSAGQRTTSPGEAGYPVALGENGHIDMDHINVDELSARIYDRLRTRLRTEFLVDRERAGLLTDFR